jgi:glucuronate isomerase
MNADDVAGLNAYIDKLAAISGTAIADYDTYLSALKARHDYFAD